MINENYGKILLAGFVVIIILVAIKIIKDPVKTNNTTTQDYYEDVRANDQIKYEAYKRAVFMVKDILKSPSTAKFPEYFDNDPKMRIYKNDSLISINSYVDSQNSFGAMLRTNFTVEMTYENGVWNLIKVVFDGEVVYP